MEITREDRGGRQKRKKKGKEIKKESKKKNHGASGLHVN